jgi:hypothetical protein
LTPSLARSLLTLLPLLFATICLPHRKLSQMGTARRQSSQSDSRYTSARWPVGGSSWL